MSRILFVLLGFASVFLEKQGEVEMLVLPFGQDEDPSTPKTPTPKIKIRVDLCGPVDLVFLIDSSGSIGTCNFAKMVTFVKTLTGRLTVTPDSARIAVISFGTEAMLHFGLDSHASLKSTEAAIDQIQWKDEWTNTGAALRVMKDQVFKTEHGDRSDAPNVAVLITDGPSNKNSWQTVPNAESARNADINIFVIGVGREVDPFEMKGIAGSKDRIKYVEDFGKLLKESTLKSMFSKICNLTTIVNHKRNIPWHCNFESLAGKGSMCEMMQSHEDAFDWILQKGPTPSRYTGPTSAYKGKYYIYTSAKYPRKEGDRAIMLFPKFLQEGTCCVKFNYHMYGYHVRELQLATMSSSGHFNNAWSMEGPRGNVWLSAAVTIYLKLSDQMAFIATRGRGRYGDIALDNIRVNSGYCDTHRAPGHIL